MDAGEVSIVLEELSYFEAVLRMLCAMLVGIIVGVERGRNHRPAGMRTHMLVALGACVTMVVSNFLFVRFRPLGATPDPARLGAQVVSGVGFLGAGTIMREGLSVKGLTTAASIWAVACLGLAAGAGYYAIALTGAAAVYATSPVTPRSHSIWSAKTCPVSCTTSTVFPCSRMPRSRTYSSTRPKSGASIT